MSGFGYYIGSDVLQHYCGSMFVLPAGLMLLLPDSTRYTYAHGHISFAESLNAVVGQACSSLVFVHCFSLLEGEGSFLSFF